MFEYEDLARLEPANPDFLAALVRSQKSRTRLGEALHFGGKLLTMKPRCGSLLPLCAAGGRFRECVYRGYRRTRTSCSVRLRL